jgi:2'-deoxynucleoside 5'-phosphate N-hydrolase
MNIYFACSITGGREFESVYQEFVATLVQAGHQIPTAHLVESGVGALEAGIDPVTVYTRDVDWIRACDVLIAEVSVPSHGVGYEIAFALGLGKPVLAIYQQGRKVSKMITGNPDMNLQEQAYQDSADGVRVLREFLARHLK